MIARFCAVLVGIALTWACAATGLFLLDDATTFRCPSKHRIARMRLGEIMQGLQEFEINNNNRCPTSYDELRERRYITSQSLRDPWGTAYEIRCSGWAFHVRSAGPDRTFDTGDDVAGELSASEMLR